MTETKTERKKERTDERKKEERKEAVGVAPLYASHRGGETETCLTRSPVEPTLNAFGASSKADDGVLLLLDFLLVATKLYWPVSFPG